MASVVPGSIAEEIGVLPGDVLLSINEEPLTDYIAYRFTITDEEVTLEVSRGEEAATITIEKEADEDLGIIFTSDIFDGLHPCRNHCVFCFEDQMPPDMRDSLNLRDDDYRLSFLHGNFLTLTNLKEEEFARIIREHLSPLFISIHAVDTAVRRKMLGNKKAPEIIPQLQRFATAGIELHGQIVLCPDWNDGAVLENTLEELTATPLLESIGIVPVGLTDYRSQQVDLRALNQEDARNALAIIEAAQARCLQKYQRRICFAADEFFLLAGAKIPAAEEYEEYPQKENGIGLARIFLDEAKSIVLPSAPPTIQHVTIVTGILAQPILEKFCARLRKAWPITVNLQAITNRFYGGGVSVAGLLTGSDLRRELTGVQLGELLILPASIINQDGLLLDDDTPEAISEALNIPLRFADNASGIIDLLFTAI